MTQGRQDTNDKHDWSEWVGDLVMDQNYINLWSMEYPGIYSSHLCKYQPHLDQETFVTFATVPRNVKVNFNKFMTTRGKCSCHGNSFHSIDMKY